MAKRRIADVPASPPEYKNKYETPEDKESRNRIFILIGIMLVLIVVGVALLALLFMGRLLPPAQITLPNATVGGNLTNATIGGCGDACLYQQAMNLTDADYCRQILDAKLKNDCYIALSNVSLTACVNVQDHATLAGCVNKFALLMNQTDICTYLPEPQATSCMAQIDPCYLNNGTPRLLCLALEKKNVSQCGADTDCIFNYSIATSNTVDCGVITQRPAQYACVASITGQDKCHDLSGAEKDLCYEIFAMRTNNSLYCTATTPDSRYMLDCIGYFVKHGADYSLCNSLTLNNRWQCYTNYSLGTGNTSGCVAIDPLASSFRFSCFFQFAKQWGDPSACDLINDAGQAVTCYVGSIMNNTNLDYRNCRDIGPIVWRNKCYTEYAKMSNDTSICNFIDTANEKSSCVGAVQQQ